MAKSKVFAIIALKYLGLFCNITSQTCNVASPQCLTHLNLVMEDTGKNSEDPGGLSDPTNETVLDAADLSLWFDHAGSCYELVGNYITSDTSSGHAYPTSTPATTVMTARAAGATTRQRLAASAALPAILETDGETFLSKTLKLVTSCHFWKATGAKMDIKDLLMVNEEDLFNQTFVTDTFIRMTEETCRHLGLTIPDPEDWSNKLKMFKIFTTIFEKYTASEEEKDFIANQLDKTGIEADNHRQMYHGIIEVLVSAGYLDKDFLDPEKSEHVEAMHQFWSMSLEAELTLRENNKWKNILRKRVIESVKFREMVDKEIADMASELIMPREFEANKNKFVSQGVVLENEVKVAVDNLVFGWTSFVQTDGAPDPDKLMVVADYGQVTLVYPAQEEDLSYLDRNDFTSIHIVEEDAHPEQITHKLVEEIKETIERLNAKAKDLESVWALTNTPTDSPGDNRRHSTGMSQAVLQGLQRSAQRAPARVATSPRDSPRMTPTIPEIPASSERVTSSQAPASSVGRVTPSRPPASDAATVRPPAHNPTTTAHAHTPPPAPAPVNPSDPGNSRFQNTFGSVDMNLTRVITCPHTGRIAISPGQRVPAASDPLPQQSLGSSAWRLGAGQGGGPQNRTINSDIIVARIEEANLLTRGTPQLTSIDDTLSLEELQFIEADITAISEAVKSIGQLQRELDKAGVPSPRVEIWTDGGINSARVSSSVWANTMTREMTLMLSRVKQRTKTKQETENEAQKALLKTVGEFELPKLDRPSEYLKWAVFHREVVLTSEATKEAASVNPGFLLSLRQKLTVTDAQETLLCSSAAELFDALNVKYLATGYAVHMSFKHVLGSMPKVIDIKDENSQGSVFTRQSKQMLNNICRFEEIMLYIIKLEQLSYIKDEHVAMIEDRLFTNDYFKIYLNITNKLAIASPDEKQAMLSKKTFGVQEMSILDESVLAASHSKSILDEVPLHLRAKQPKPLIDLNPPTSRNLEAADYCRILVILAKTVKGSAQNEKVRASMRAPAPATSTRPSRTTFKPAQKTASFGKDVPINNSELDEVRENEYEDIGDEDINVTDVDGTRKPVPKAPCPLNCGGGHPVALGSAKWCKKFKRMKVKERKLAVRDTPLCPRCLCKKHPPGKKCQAKITCQVCKSEDHNSMIHEDEGVADLNNIDGDEEEDLSCFMTDELVDELEEVLDINLTHLGQMDQGSEVFNAISYDPEAVQILRKMIEKAKPASVNLEFDDWTESQKEKSKDLFNALKSSILEAKSEHLEELEKDDLDINLAELTERFRNSSQKVSSPDFEQRSSFVHFQRSGESNQRAKRPVAREQLQPSLLKEIMRSNSDLICASQSPDEINSSSSYSRVSINSFDRIMNIQQLLSEICELKQLTFTLIDLIVDDMTEQKLTALAKMEDIKVRLHDGQWLVTCNALLDEGSSTNLLLSPLVDVLRPRRLHRIKATITTVNGSSTITDFKYKMDMKVAQNSIHSITAVKMDKISGYKPFSQFEVACLENILGLDEESIQWFNVSTVPIKTYVLIGCEEGDLKTVRILDSASIGLKYNLLSQRLKITYIPFSAGPKFSISGSFGVNPSLVSKKHQFPPVFVPKVNNADQWIKRETLMFTKLLESPESLTQASNLGQFLSKQLESASDTVNIIKLTDVDCDIKNEVVDVNYTQVDAKNLITYIEGEKALLTPFLLCPAHEKVRLTEMSSCKDCVIRNQNEEQGKELARFEDLWDKVYLVKWKDRERVMLHLPFDRPVDQIGEKYHNNLVPAYRASVSLYKKCVKEGSLELIDSQFRSRIANGQLTPLTEDEINKIMSGEIKSNCILRGKVQNMKSESSPARIICNTSHKIDFSGSTLVTSDPCPKHDLVDLLGVSLKTFTSPTAVFGDIKGAYLAVGLSDPTKYFYINILFIHPEKYGTKYPICLKSENLDFGLGSASIILRIGILKYAVPRCKMTESKETLKKNTYIDNVGFLTIPSPSTLGLSLIDVKTAMDAQNMLLDKFYIPEWLFNDPGLKDFKDKYKIEFKPRTTTLGLEWCLQSDSVAPATRLSIHPTHRGIPTGETLRKTDLMVTLLTRRMISRLIAQAWDSSGRFLGVAQASAKWILTRVCKILSLTEMDTPIIDKDQELGMAAAAFWTNLSQTDIAPFSRCTVKNGWRIVALVIDHDASISLVGAVIYVISESKTGARESHVLASKSVLSWSSVISNETRGHAVASHLLLTIVSAIKPVLDAYGFSPVIVVVTDNLPTSYLYREDSKQTLTRNVRHTVLANLSTLHTLLPMTTVTHCWLPSRFLSSDFLSKFFPNPADIINGEKWRKGCEEYLRFEHITHFWYMKVNAEETHYRELPTTLQLNDKMSFSELVARNPLTDSELHQVHFDKLNNKVKELFPIKKDDKVTDDLVLNMISDNAIEVCIDNFLADAEIENMAGYHEDDYNRAFVAKYSNAMMTANMEDDEETHEWVNIIMTRKMTQKADQKKDIPKCNIALFTSGADKVKQDNIINSLEALDDFGYDSHLKKDFYNNLMQRTFNIIKIINILILLMRVIPRRRKEGDSLVQRAWATLILTDQFYYPADKSSLINSIIRIKNIDLVALRPHDLVIPLLNADSPLMTRILYTVHRHPTDVEKFPNQHVPMSSLRNTIMRSMFGVYTLSLDKSITRMLSTCTKCLRTMLKRFKVPQGARFALINPDQDILTQVSVDPLGPVVIRSHIHSKRSTVQCWIIVVTCHQTGCMVMELVGDLTHQSIILGLKQAEQRHNVSFSEIYVDAGSSLSAALLENDLRPWKVFQHPAMGHSRVYSESKIGKLKPMWNKIFNKFRRESKTTCPISIFELIYIITHLQLQINTTPYSRFSSFAPSTLLHARGLEVSEMFKDLEEAENGCQPLDRLTSWLRSMRELRNEMLGDILTERSSLKNVNGPRFHPMNGDVCVALTGNESKCELVTVWDDGIEPIEADKKLSIEEMKEISPECDTWQKLEIPDKSKRKDNKSEFTERTVLVKSGTGKPKPYPVDSLRLLTEGEKRRNRRLNYHKFYPAENPF